VLIEILTTNKRLATLNLGNAILPRFTVTD